MNSIILDSLSVNGGIVRYKFNVSPPLANLFKTKELFIDYGFDVSTVPVSILTIPFVGCLSAVSWIYNVSLWCDEIDKTFFYALKQLKVAYQEAHYEYPFQGRFIPSRIIENSITEDNGSILLFGGGVDCQSSYIRNSGKISQIVNINGWLESVDESNLVDDFDQSFTQKFAEMVGVSSCHIRSNFASMFNLSEIDRQKHKLLHTGFWYGFLHSMAFISISIPIAYYEGRFTIYIASSNTKGQSNVCASDITTDSLFQFATNGFVVHDGFELNRQDKIRIIVDYKKSHNIVHYPLHVCSFKDHQCCACEKCFRTLTSLIAENEDPRDYGFVVEGDMRTHWEKVLENHLALWGIDLEMRTYWPYTKERMLENYEHIADKEFVDWFLSFDFKEAKKKALIKYYKNNFFKIVKRKLHLS